MDSAQLDELERLAAQATPGPWFVTCNCTGKTFYTIKNDRVYIGETLGVYNGEANAAYIAAACNAVPELIKMYREADDEAADANSAWQKVRRENLALREQVRELERQRELMADGLELYCNYVHREDGDCPFWIECPKGGLCTGEVTDKMWIEFFEREAAKEAENGQCKD